MIDWLVVMAFFIALANQSEVGAFTAVLMFLAIKGHNAYARRPMERFRPPRSKYKSYRDRKDNDSDEGSEN